MPCSITEISTLRQKQKRNNDFDGEGILGVQQVEQTKSVHLLLQTDSSPHASLVFQRTLLEKVHGNQQRQSQQCEA